MVPFNITKIANAIIYFVDNDVQNLGKTKLMKLLFYTDKYHLEKFGKSVFGDTYHKLPQGPVPTITLNIINSLNESEEDDFTLYANEFSQYVETKDMENYGYKTMQFIPTADFNRKLFSRSEIEIMNLVIKRFKSYSAAQISDKSHTTPEWIEAYDAGVISEESMSGKNKEYVAYWNKLHSSFDMMVNPTK